MDLACPRALLLRGWFISSAAMRLCFSMRAWCLAIVSCRAASSAAMDASTLVDLGTALVATGDAAAAVPCFRRAVQELRAGRAPTGDGEPASERRKRQRTHGGRRALGDAAFFPSPLQAAQLAYADALARIRDVAAAEAAFRQYWEGEVQPAHAA